MKRFLAAVLFLLVPSLAQAQSLPNPTFYQGFIPTAAQWNNYFKAKQDALGYKPVNKAGDIMQGKLTMTPTVATLASFNLACGTAPTVPINGDMWCTTLGVYAQIAGVTIGPIGGSPATQGAILAPCQLATTGNITLSGEQTIDGVLTSASRVCVIAQSTASQNGIYTSGAGAWTRTADFNTTGQVVQGTQVYVNGGDKNSGLSFAITSANPITIGSSAINFYQKLNNTTPEAFGAVGDGITDDTTALNKAFAIGAELIGTTGKSYLVSAPLLTVVGCNIHGDFAIKVAASFVGSRVIIPASNCIFSDFTIDGSAYVTAATGFNGIYATSPVSNVTIQNVTFNNIMGKSNVVGAVPGAAVGFAAGAGNIRVINNTFSNSGWNVTVFVDTTTALIDGNTSTSSGSWFSSLLNTNNYITFTNNKVYRSTPPTLIYSGAGSAAGAQAGAFVGLTFSGGNNVIDGNYYIGTGTTLTDCIRIAENPAFEYSPHKITKNTIINCSGFGIDVASNFTVEQNYISGDTNRAILVGLDLGGVIQNAHIKNNTIINTGDASHTGLSAIQISPNNAVAVTGTADNGSGFVRVAVSTTAGLLGGSTYINGVVGTTEANGAHAYTIIDGTHIDLTTVAYANAYISGGYINAGVYNNVALSGNVVSDARSPQYTASGLSINTFGAFFTRVQAMNNEFTQTLAGAQVDIIGGGSTTGLQVFNCGSTSNSTGFVPVSYTLTSGGLQTCGHWASTSDLFDAGIGSTLGETIARGVSGWEPIAGNTTTTRKFYQQTGNGTISALPAFGPIAAADVPGSALTKTDDTNVTVTLGGSPSTALLNAASLTMGWTGRLSYSRFTQGAADTVLANPTSSLADYQAFAMPSCTDTTGNHLNYVSGTGITCGTSSITASKFTNSLGGDVALNNTSNFFTGPTVAQGTSGTWWAAGTITLQDTSGIATFQCKLWDGTTVISSGQAASSAINLFTTIALSGYISSPAANITISCKDGTSTSGAMKYNPTGTGKDSTLSVFRIQ